MLIYRFRITSEEHDGFLREIDIQPNQTFLEFHHILLESAELLHGDRASFFITDKKFKKEHEISLKSEKRQVRKYDEDLDQVVTDSVALPLMKAEKIKTHVEDPHQRMIYEFWGREFFRFHIELYKIAPAEAASSYPKCIRRQGDLPKKAEPPAVQPDEPVEAKIPVPKPPSQIIDRMARLDSIVEDDEEIAAIESELEGLLDDGDDAEGHAAEGMEEETVTDDFLYEGQADSGSEDDEESLDHIEDFDDIDHLDQRMKGFDRDRDDY